VAARLGDADAQQDLAFCLANGKGCKKDKKEAAKWHRAAVSAIECNIASGRPKVLMLGCPRRQRYWFGMDIQGKVSVVGTAHRVTVVL
jgi:hypothetical protein